MTALLEEQLETIDTAEVHWGTSTILAVFFAASLISAVFFGLGYSFGRGGTAKMVAGTGGIGAAGSEQPVDQVADRNSSGAIRRDGESTRAMHAASRKAASVPVGHLAAVSVVAKKPAAIEMHAKAALPDVTAGHYMVQVGAIGNRRDAQMLVAQLHKRGFHSGIYPGKHDKYLHVQIGPFTTAEQANAMRHRVAADGFHAILKRAS